MTPLGSKPKAGPTKLPLKVKFGCRYIRIFIFFIVWLQYIRIVPTKVCFFAWEAFWGKVLTLDQLKKRGRCLANRCFLRCEEKESIDHILIQRSKARVLWELLFALFGVTWVLPYSVRDTLSGWSGFNMGKKHRKVWKVAPSCIFWAVWKERNKITFDNEELSMNRLKNSFVCNLWVWFKSVVNEGPLSLLGFFDWLGAR